MSEVTERTRTVSGPWRKKVAREAREAQFQVQLRSPGTQNKLANLPELQFSHPENGKKNTYFIGLWRESEMIHKKSVLHTDRRGMGMYQ